MCAYPYTSQLSPAVGNGLPGLPRRAASGTAAPAVSAPSVKKIGSLSQPPDRGIITRAPYNSVLWGFLGSYTASGSYQATYHALRKNDSPVTFSLNATGGSAAWPGLKRPANVQDSMVSLTLGGDGSYSSPTYAFGFAADYTYRATTASGSSVNPGFFVDEPDTDYLYLVATDGATSTANVAKLSKSTMTSVWQKQYSTTLAPLAAWVYGAHLYFIDNSSPNAHLVQIDKSTGVVVGSWTLPAAVNNSSGTYIQVADDCVGFIGSGITTIYVIDKATLNVTSAALTFGSGTSSQDASVFCCSGKLLAATYIYDANTSKGLGYVTEYTPTGYTQKLYIEGASWGTNQIQYMGALYARDSLTIPYVNDTSGQSVDSSTYDWSIRYSDINSGMASVALSNLNIYNYSGSGAMTAASKTAGASAAATSASKFTSFVRYPHRINW